MPSIKPSDGRSMLGMIPIYVAVFMTGVQISFLLSDDAITDAGHPILGHRHSLRPAALVGAFASFSYLRPTLWIGASRHADRLLALHGDRAIW